MNSIENTESPKIEDASSEILQSRQNLKPWMKWKNRQPSTYKIRLELGVVLVYFAMNLSSTVYQDQVLLQSCTAVFGYNKSTCSELGTNQENVNPELKNIENVVQPYASEIFMAGSLIQGIIPAFIALFAGAWSDKFGRKPVILSACIGYLCFFIIKTIVAAVSITKNVNPWFYVIASIPVTLSGGDCMLVSAIYCYVADLTNFYERPYKMCFMGGIMALGEFLGQLISSYLLKATNASSVFAVSAVAQLLGILFIIFFIQESVKKEQLSQSSKVRGLLDWQLFKDMIATVMKKRQHFGRSVIWCIILPLTAITFDQAGSGNVFFLFVRTRLNWSVQTFTTYNAIKIVIDFVGAVIGIIAIQFILGFKQTSVSLISYACLLVYAAFCAAAAAPWYLFVGASLSFLSGIATPMGQAMLSNTVPLCDIGKVFALMTALGAIAPLASAPLYTYVYNSTLATYPGAFNLISVGLYLLCFLATLYVHLIDMRYPNVNKEKK